MNGMERSALHKLRIVLITGLIGGCMTFMGDFILGYGTYDESLTGLERKLSTYLPHSDALLFWSAFLGLIGISLEGVCYLGVCRLISKEGAGYARMLRAGAYGYMIFAPCGVHVPCLSAVFFHNHMAQVSPETAYDLTVRFGMYFLLPATILFLVFLIIMNIGQIGAFAKGHTPFPKRCWIFCLPIGMAATMLLKLAGNHALASALTAGWISIGNIWMFGGLLLSMKHIRTK